MPVVPFDPYAPPTSRDPWLDPRAPLFPAAHVALAALFGSPFAGAILVAVNAHRLGQRGTAIGALCVGGLASAASLAAVPILYPRLTLPFFLASLVLTTFAARAVHERAVRAHVAGGGEIGSRWTALGVGVLCSGVIGALALTLLGVAYYARRRWLDG